MKTVIVTLMLGVASSQCSVLPSANSDIAGTYAYTSENSNGASTGILRIEVNEQGAIFLAWFTDDGADLTAVGRGYILRSGHDYIQLVAGYVTPLAGYGVIVYRPTTTGWIGEFPDNKGHTHYETLTRIDLVLPPSPAPQEERDDPNPKLQVRSI